MTAIMPMDEPRPRGTVMGKQVSGPPLDEAGHFFRCPLCGGYVDMRDGFGSTITKARCRTRRAIGRSKSLIQIEVGAKVLAASSRLWPSC